MYAKKKCKHCGMPIVELPNMWTHVMTGNKQCQPTTAEPEEEDAVQAPAPLRSRRMLG